MSVMQKEGSCELSVYLTLFLLPVA